MSRYWFSWEHATDWAFSLYLHLMSLTRNKQKTPYPKCRVFGTEKGGSGEEKLSALSPHMGHCTGMGSPSQTSGTKLPINTGWRRRGKNTCAGGSPRPALKHQLSFTTLASNSPTLSFPCGWTLLGAASPSCAFLWGPQKMIRTSQELHLCSVEMRGGQ